VTSPTAAGPLRRKSLAILREGRLNVLYRRMSPDTDTIVVAVQSSREGGPTYAIDLVLDEWTCTCRERTGCAHIGAAQLVTGWTK
jgi:hypothetical protein